MVQRKRYTLKIVGLGIGIKFQRMKIRDKFGVRILNGRLPAKFDMLNVGNKVEVNSVLGLIGLRPLWI